MAPGPCRRRRHGSGAPGVAPRCSTSPCASPTTCASTSTATQVRDELIGLGQKVERKPESARIDTSSGSSRSCRRSTAAPSTSPRRRTASSPRASAWPRRRSPTPASVVAPLVMSKPKVTGFADVILVRTGENRLYHYENGVLAKTYTVATGTPRLPDAQGQLPDRAQALPADLGQPRPDGLGQDPPQEHPARPRQPARHPRHEPQLARHPHPRHDATSAPSAPPRRTAASAWPCPRSRSSSRRSTAARR